MDFMVWLLLGALVQEPSTLRTIDKGDHSLIADGRQVIVRTPTEWHALWREHAGERERPAADLSREMIVGVFLGSRPTAGFRIEIVGVDERDSGVVVRYRETRPSPGGLTAQVLTSPYHLVALAQRPGEVRFERVER
jgi:hypothetical protein